MAEAETRRKDAIKAPDQILNQRPREYQIPGISRLPGDEGSSQPSNSDLPDPLKGLFGK